MWTITESITNLIDFLNSRPPQSGASVETAFWTPWRTSHTLITDYGCHLYPGHSKHSKRIISFITIPLPLISHSTPPGGQIFSPAQRLFGSSLLTDLPKASATSEPLTPPRDITPTRGAKGTKNQRTTFSQRVLTIISPITQKT